MVHAGDKISAAYTVKNNNYTDKNTNKMIYGLVLQIERISLKSPKQPQQRDKQRKPQERIAVAKRKSTSKKTA